MLTFENWISLHRPASARHYINDLTAINVICKANKITEIKDWSLSTFEGLLAKLKVTKEFIAFESTGNSRGTAPLSNYKLFLEYTREVIELTKEKIRWDWGSPTGTLAVNLPQVLLGVTKALKGSEKPGIEFKNKLIRLQSDVDKELAEINKVYIGGAKLEVNISKPDSGPTNEIIEYCGQYWKKLGLLEDRTDRRVLTELGKKIANNEIGQDEFLKYNINENKQILNHNYLGGPYNRLRTIIDILSELSKIKNNEYLTVEEAGRIILPGIYLALPIKEIAKNILEFRKGSTFSYSKVYDTFNPTGDKKFLLQHFIFLYLFGVLDQKLGSTNETQYILRDKNENNMTKPLESASKIVESEEIKSILKMAEFYFEKGQQELTNLKSHSMLDEKYLALFDDYKSKKIDILSYLDLNADPIEKAYLEKVLKFYSYVDMNSPGKNSYNDYIDKRVVTRMSLWTRSWFQGITKFKFKGNDLNELTLDSNLYNAIYYLEKPEESFPIVSRKHKANISLNLLGKPYDESNFAKDIIAFFEPLNLDITNDENLTVILSKIIYDYNFRGFWDIIPQQITDKFISEFMKYLVSQNLIFDEKLIARFICSLATKPFLILTGNSGTGKSRIALEFAKWINFNQSEEKKHVLVPVGADWTDKRPIFGFYNPLTEKYISTPILEMILEAEQDEDSPYFLILDEMNLSHVERYFSDFLSILESPTESITLHESGDSAPCSGNDRSIPNKLFLPKNLFVIGTVNIDETTYMFSPKVLDRANVIEISASINDLKEFTPKPTAKYKMEHDCFSAFLNLSLTARGYLLNDKYNEIDSKTIKIGVLNYFQILQNHDLEFGFRTLNEAINYFKVRKTINKTVSIHETLSEQVVQKFITKLNGSRAKLERLLVELYILSKIYDDKKAIITEGDVKKVSEKLKDYTSLSKVFEDDAVVTNLASVKIKKMTKKLNREQFVSFI
jgi:hypothetical protein